MDRQKQIEVSDLDGYNWNWFERYGDEVVKELAAAFSAALTFDLPDAPIAEVQRLASQFAEHRGTSLLKLDGPENLVRLTRERVNVLVADTLANGESLGTLVKNLRADVAFSRTRARMVARTETATALGQGSKESAKMQGRDEKHWVTQGDDLVSQEICAPNEAVGWIPMADLFPSGHDTIPGHINCRCVTRYRTKALHEESLLSEARCPDCGKLLAKSVNKAILKCPRCKKEVHFDYSKRHLDSTP